jgi:hypothetical protein
MPFNPLQYPLINMPPRLVSMFSHWVGHIPFAFGLMQMARPRTVVELGTAHGDSYFAFCQAVVAIQLQSQTRCWAIDMWPNDQPAGHNGDEILASLKPLHDAELAVFSTLIRSSFDQAAPNFKPVSIDLLHMDGNPSYPALQHDLHTWLPRMSDRGIILLHGISMHVADGGAKKLWAELSMNRPHFAFEHAGGLGVVAVGANVPKPVLEFLRDANTDPRAIQTCFARLGQTIEMFQGQRRMANSLLNMQAFINDWKRQAGHWVDPKGIDVNLANTDGARFSVSVFEQLRFALNDDLNVRKQLTPLPHIAPTEIPAPRSFSVIICSVDNARFAAVDAMYRRILKDYPAQIIRISDAKGMCEGYNRGIDQSTGDALIFSHDDVEILNDDFAVKLLKHLEKYDLIGVAGTTRLCAGHWVAAGPPYLFGQVPEPAPQGGYVVQLFGGAGPICENIQAVDGLMFAVRRSVVEKIRFDESFDGFHLYDLDFSATVHAAGYKLAVARDLFVIHASAGNFDNRWKQYAEKFEKKWAGKLPPHPRRQFHNCVVVVPSKDEIVEVMKVTI